MTELSVFTLNIWGLGYGIASNRKERVAAIGNHLAQSDYDIVLLQEVWCIGDYETIREMTKECLPVCHLFRPGLIGTGTCLLARGGIRLLDVAFHQFSLNGYPHKILHGDWFAGKGVGVCRVQHVLSGLILHVYVSHFHAEYNRQSDVYLPHRLVQAIEAAQLVRLSSAGADAVIYAGDFNTEPSDLPYSIIRHVGGLRDTWEEFARETGKIARETGGGTCGTFTNSYTTHRERSERSNGKRIDYILCSTPGLHTRMTVLHSSLPLASTLPQGSKVSYSDHEAVCTRFLLEKSPQPLTSSLQPPITILEPPPDNNNKETSELDSTVTAGLTLLSSALLHLTLLSSALLHLTSQSNSWKLFAAVAAAITAAVNLSCYCSGEEHLGLSRVLLLLVGTILTLYSIFMATAFNRLERNSLEEAKATLDVIRKRSAAGVNWINSGDN